ncbi:transposase [Fibrobacter sp. UWT2]|uniref:helix-turn-helix domain-containing protein n=1 Tax=Fibrobacter sp. UWT2 TaxID=1896224 RepID=UPI000916BADB|nr:helix-turn-helix domain-containing protein [Fibrobacter sp. UWT2]SHK53898.1 transposase [Fibrobacter sp. UWT2]
MNHYKEAEWQKAFDLCKEGVNPRSISRIVGLSERDVKHRCRMYHLTGIFQVKPRIGHPTDWKTRKSAVDSVIKKSLSYVETCAKFEISRHTLKDWLKKFRQGGYDNLKDKKPQRGQPRMPRPKKKRDGMTELELLREENQYLKAEVAYLKKLKALDQEESTRMFGVGPKSSED